VILVWGRTKPQLVQASDTILGTPQPESRSPETWTIYVVHGETRDVDVALHGESAAPGVLPLVDELSRTARASTVAESSPPDSSTTAGFIPHHGRCKSCESSRRR
jgi:hypothetical protein